MDQASVNMRQQQRIGAADTRSGRTGKMCHLKRLKLRLSTFAVGGAQFDPVADFESPALPPTCVDDGAAPGDEEHIVHDAKFLRFSH